MFALLISNEAYFRKLFKTKSRFLLGVCGFFSVVGCRIWYNNNKSPTASQWITLQIRANYFFQANALQL